MKCGFEYKECTEKCRFFETCARNPHREEQNAAHGSSQEEKENEQ